MGSERGKCLRMWTSEIMLSDVSQLHQAHMFTGILKVLQGKLITHEGDRLSLDRAISHFCLWDRLYFIHTIMISDVIIEINGQEEWSNIYWVYYSFYIDCIGENSSGTLEVVCLTSKNTGVEVLLVVIGGNERTEIKFCFACCSFFWFDITYFNRTAETDPLSATLLNSCFLNTSAN